MSNENLSEREMEQLRVDRLNARYTRKVMNRERYIRQYNRRKPKKVSA